MGDLAVNAIVPHLIVDLLDKTGNCNLLLLTLPFSENIGTEAKKQGAMGKIVGLATRDMHTLAGANDDLTFVSGNALA